MIGKRYMNLLGIVLTNRLFSDISFYVIIRKQLFYME